MRISTKTLYRGFVAVACFLFTNARASADNNIYVGDIYDDSIMEYDLGGHGSRFGSASQPHALAIDSNGDLYAQSGGNVLRFDSSGHSTVFASGLIAQGLAFDSSGNLFAFDSWSLRILKIDPSGHSSVFINSGVSSASGLAFDRSGNLYVADGGAIYKFDPSGNKTLFSSVGALSLAFDASGNLYASDMSAEKILKVDSSGHSSDFVSAPKPRGIAFDSSGNLYVACLDNGMIQKFDSSGHGTVFATGLNGPWSIAIQVPEPSTWSLLALGIGALLGGGRLRRFAHAFRREAKSQIALLAFLILLTFSTISPCRGTVLTFDDLPCTTDEILLTNYHGLVWDNFYVLNAFFRPVNSRSNGYYFGMVTVSNVAFNGLGLPAEIDAAGTNFNFLSVYLTGAWYSNMNIEVSGFRSGSLIYDQTVVVSMTNPTLFTFNYLDIDQLYFKSFGGQRVGLGLGRNFAMDNFTFELVPEPSSLLLTATGALLAWPLLKRKRA